MHKNGSLQDPNNYRPIALANNRAKIIEAAVKKQFLEYLNQINYFNNNQHGFRKGHGTNTALLQVTEEIRKALDQGESILALFLDLAKAFDTVNHEILLQKLKNNGCNSDTLLWFKSYLQNRNQYISLNGIVSNNLNNIHGVPQGSVLGPILFIFYINDLLNVDTTGKMIMYTDDTVILFRHKINLTRILLTLKLKIT